MFKSKFRHALVSTLPTLVWGHMLQRMLHCTAPVFLGAEWIPALFGTAVLAYGGVPCLQGPGGKLLIVGWA
jgi:P-type Cu2+ transporter